MKESPALVLLPHGKEEVGLGVHDADLQIQDFHQVPSVFLMNDKSRSVVHLFGYISVWPGAVFQHPLCPGSLSHSLHQKLRVGTQTPEYFKVPHARPECFPGTRRVITGGELVGERCACVRPQDSTAEAQCEPLGRAARQWEAFQRQVIVHFL